MLADWEAQNDLIEGFGNRVTSIPAASAKMNKERLRYNHVLEVPSFATLSYYFI